MFLYWGALYVYATILSVYAASLGASFTTVGMVVGAYGFVQVFLASSFRDLVRSVGATVALPLRWSLLQLPWVRATCHGTEYGIFRSIPWCPRHQRLYLGRIQRIIRHLLSAK